jgi:predicted nucleic acid-binding protein
LIVVAAAVVLLLDRIRPSSQVAARLAAETSPLAAPHLVDAEVGHALRRAVLRGGLPAVLALAAFDDLAALQIERFDHTMLLARAFERRDSALFYEGLYLALAEILGVPLVARVKALGRGSGSGFRSRWSDLPAHPAHRPRRTG